MSRQLLCVLTGLMGGCAHVAFDPDFRRFPGEPFPVDQRPETGDRRLETGGGKPDFLGLPAGGLQPAASSLAAMHAPRYRLVWREAADGAAPPELPAPGAAAVQPAPADGEPSAPAAETAKLNTEDAPVVAEGQFEFKLRYDFIAAANQFNGNGAVRGRGLRHDHVVIGEIKYGVGGVADVGVSLGVARLRDRDAFVDPGTGTVLAGSGTGITDFAASGKWMFLENEEKDFALAYVFGFTFPVGRHTQNAHLGPSQQHYDFNQLVAATKTVGPWCFCADVGFVLPFGGGRGDLRGRLVADAAVGFQILDWLQPEIELNFAHAFNAGSPNTDSLSITAGVVMPLGDLWRVEAGVQQTIWGRNTDMTTTGIVAVLFKL